MCDLHDYIYLKYIETEYTYIYFSSKSTFLQSLIQFTIHLNIVLSA